MNKTAAKEWLTKAWHHLSTAQLLFQLEHYTDIIAIEIHYSVEITLKAFLAYDNSKIFKTHDLIDVYKHIKYYINFDDAELSILEQISEYHIGESYPSSNRNLIPLQEIKDVLEFAEELFDRVCAILNIDKTEIIKR